MKMFVTLLALVAIVGVFLLPALAQGPKADPGPEQDGMARMMGMMSQPMLMTPLNGIQSVCQLSPRRKYTHQAVTKPARNCKINFSCT